MKVYLNNDSEKGLCELSVDAYGLLSKRQFAIVLGGVDGVSILKKPTILDRNVFCHFKYEGEDILVIEDDYDYTFLLKPLNYNPEVLKPLESFFENYYVQKPKTRPAFWFAGCVLLILAVYVNVWGG